MLLGLSPAGAGPPITEIDAAGREAFERWVNEEVGQIIPPELSAFPAKGKNSAADRDATLEQGLNIELKHSLIHALRLKQANVDWKSFLHRGRKNKKFPGMLVQCEFVELPLYYANPIHAVRKISGKLPEASNVLPGGGVSHCSFFTNTRIESYTPRRIAEEFASFQPRGPMRIKKVKTNGTSEGLWITDEAGRTYIVIFDSPFAPEMTTSAEYIGSTLVRIAGYHVPRTCICTISGTGDSLYDGRRAVATIALENFDGGWRYADFKDRREIRALQVFAGWINNVDQTEQNTGATVDSAGVCRHYVLDFGASLGSFTFRPQLARLGWTRLFDPFEQFTQPLYDRGLRKVPWQAPYSVHSPAVGYFSADYDPDRWQPFYRNLGFLEVTEADRVWAARRIARFMPEQIRAVVELAGYSNACDAEHVLRTLLARREIILRRYLAEHRRPRHRATSGTGPSISAP